MKFHTFAEIFPLLDDAEFDALVADIKTHGLREHIWLYEGKILDGRNRFLACKTAKVEPKFREYKGNDALAFVVSSNVHRRHLTESQRAMAAAKVATMTQGARTDIASIEAKSQTTAADELKVGRSSVQRAKKVIEKGSKALQKAVETGEVSVSKAAKVVDLPKPEQLKAAKAKAPAPTEPEEDSDAPERPDIDDAEEDAALARAEARAKEDRERRVDKILESDDQLAESLKQLTQQSALIGTLETTRDGFMRGKESVTKLLKAEQAKVARLEKKLKAAEDEIDKLRKRIAMTEAA